MKKYLLMLVVALALIGCAGGPKIDAPLETGAEVDPPFGCVELRKENGAC